MLKVLDAIPQTLKVLWACAELGLEFEREDVGGEFGGNDTPEFGH